MKNLALIGAGYWGKNLARNFHNLGALHTLCDASEKTLSSYGDDYKGVSKTTDLGAVLRDPAITRVAIAAPAALHYDLVKKALEAGKDVFVEKPVCLDINQGKDLIVLANTKGLILMVGHLLQYHPCIRALHELLAKGDLGKLQYITSNRLNLGKIRKEENALWSFAPHDISVLLSLVQGQLPSRVICTGHDSLTPGVADTTLTALDFGEVKAHIYVSWLNPFKEQKLTVVGSHGMVVFDDTKPWKEKLVIYRNHLTWSGGGTPSPNKNSGELVVVDESEPLGDECRHFLDCCDRRTPARTDGEEGLRVLQVLDAAQRSLDRNGEAINPADVSFSATQVSDFFVHPTAIVGAGANVGEGTKIWHFSHVMEGAQVGKNCNLGQNVVVSPGVKLGNNVKVQNNISIYGGTVIEDDVFLGPACALTNVTNPRSEIKRHSLFEKTLIRRGSSIGANATIVCGTTLGRYSFVAAGAVVTKDVPDYGFIVGVPGRQKGWMSRHGHMLHFDEHGHAVCPESGLRYELVNGRVRCLDLGEDDPLPGKYRDGKLTYDELKIGNQEKNKSN
jgi:UDP-2-acetamido-3-amino-2,3-dideoxy-glucuronate N-acetyltransferase